MKHLIGGLAVTLTLASAAPAAAQQVPAERRTDVRAEVDRIVEESGVVAAVEALGTAVTPELERTVEQLAESLSALVTRIARDAELRASALRAARGAVEVADIVVVEQTSVLQELLRAAADRLEAAAAREARQPPSPRD